MSKQDEILSQYAESMESENNMDINGNPNPVENVPPRDESRVETIQAVPRERVQTKAEATSEHYHSDPRYTQNRTGWQPIPIEELPTKGLFYPENASLLIRAARAAEIKHWSTMQDNDAERLNETDEMVNWILEKCVTFKSDTERLSFEDLKEVDRLYILFAIRELTFLPGQNDLMVPISEGKEIPLQKEMVDFIEIPEGMMKYYNSEGRCFTFPMSTGRNVNIFIPSIGVSKWLKSYVAGKQQSREVFDLDFINYAGLLIKNRNNLTVKTYEEMVSSASGWGAEDWSLLSHVRDALANATSPEIKYNDENGQEVRIPFTFRGGFKAIFVIQNTLF